MLVLSRKAEESIIIGDDPDMEKNVRVTVIEIRGDKVRLGITADISMPVHREEVYTLILQERQKAQEDPQIPLKPKTLDTYVADKRAGKKLKGGLG